MEYNLNKTGYIEVICGPMFAGKTEELIRRIVRMEYAKKKFLAFKPAIDDRYSKTEIASHNSRKIEAININKASDIYKFLDDSIQAVVIDEVQFFDEEMIKVCNDLASKGLRVICGGLDLDFRGEPFGIMPKLLAYAEKITKLTAICLCCGEEATRTQRIIDGHEAYYDDPVVLVGAKESYEARCRKCHKVLFHE
ncbi:MAG: thymidine kinase [bacterium]|nr:thymidine kinase [bacterium]